MGQPFFICLVILLNQKTLYSASKGFSAGP